MDQHSVDLDLDTALAAPGRCPACRSADLRPQCDEQGLVFLCAGCTRAWVAELGTLVPAAPTGSPGGAPPRPGGPTP